MGGFAMCQACWALASRRSGEASLGARDAALAKPRFAAVAEWVSEPLEDDRRTDVAGGASPPAGDGEVP
jgi:hypothetical protein